MAEAMAAGFTALLNAVFDTSRHGWKTRAAKELGISRPRLDRYLAWEAEGDIDAIPAEIWDRLQRLNVSSQTPAAVMSVESMVRELARGLVELQEKVDEIGHILAPYPLPLRRGFNLAALLNIELGKFYPVNLIEFLVACQQPLYQWCPDYDGADAEEFGAVVLFESGSITEDCLRFVSASSVDEEHRYYETVMAACSTMAPADAQAFYVAWRRTVIDSPTVASRSVFLLDPVLRRHPADTIELVNQFYRPLLPIHCVDGKVPICPVSKVRVARVNGVWTSESRDPLARQLLEQHGPQMLDYGPDMLELKRPARLFWALPGVTEVQLYEDVLALGYDAELWPQMDAVDLLIHHPTRPQHWAVDVKVHRSAIGLARSFKEFKAFKRHRLAIVVPDYLLEINRRYIEQFTRARRSGLRTEARILPSSDLLAELREAL